MLTALVRDMTVEIATGMQMMIGRTDQDADPRHQTERRSRTEKEGTAGAGMTCPAIPVTTGLLSNRTGATRRARSI
jgi:hypothetical protein